MDEITRLLKAGMKAVKAGQREQGKALLLQVIEKDEENERAWLWLSGAVDTEEERRICLENVLTINPNNELAKKGLARLKPVPQEEIEMPASFTADESPEASFESVSEASLPPSLEARAAQFNRYEPQEEKGWWMDEPISEPAKTVTQFNDVWSSREEICAFCAEPVEQMQTRCTKCKRPLLAKVLANTVPGPYYNRLRTWVTVFASLRLFVILFLLIVIFSEGLASELDAAGLLTDLMVTFAPLVIAVVGIYRREAWAYWLLLIVSIIETGGLALLAFSSGDFVVLFCLSPLLLLSAYVLFTIYMAGEDFKKKEVRRIAAISDRLREPRELDKVAQQLAKEGKWASAVLHWQRAVGRASGHAPYLLRLGHAFAELGFYERSLDILHPALETARHNETRQEIEQELVRVKQLKQSFGGEQPG